MNYQERVDIIRNYRFPLEIKEFAKNNPLKKSGFRYWYSENGQLKKVSIKKITE